MTARPTPVLFEPWEEPERQHATMLFGLWLFLATEVLFFGGLFFLYVAARVQDPAGFAAGARAAEVTLGTINTALLITSSATLTVAERAAQAGWAAAARAGLLATAALGLAFLAVKGWEYREDLHQHLFPGVDGFPFAQVGAVRFWTLYWTITLVHAVHLSIGIGLVARLIWLLRGDRILGRWMTAEVTTVYWHLVDIVWLLAWPLIYLVGR